MNLAPLMTASPAVQIHVASAVAAMALGALVLFRRKGGRHHKLMGRAFGIAMLVAALSSFWISGIRMVGPFSPIHLISVWTLIAVVLGVIQARRGDLRAHRGTMVGLYAGGIGVAGGLSLLPGRVMNEIVFTSGTGFLVFAAGAALVGAALYVGGRRRRIRTA